MKLKQVDQYLYLYGVALLLFIVSFFLPVYHETSELLEGTYRGWETVILILYLGLELDPESPYLLALFLCNIFVALSPLPLLPFGGERLRRYATYSATVFPLLAVSAVFLFERDSLMAGYYVWGLSIILIWFSLLKTDARMSLRDEPTGT